MSFSANKFFLFLFLLIAFTRCHTKAQEGNVVKCKISDCKYEKAILLSVYGSDNTPIDSVKIRNNSFTFEMKDEYSTGMYRLMFNDTSFFSVLYNNETISIEANNNLDINSIIIRESDENKIFYEYLLNEAESSEQISKIFSIAQRLYFQDKEKYKDSINNLRIEAEKIDIAKRDYALKLAGENKQLFVSKILRSMQIPDLASFSAEHPTNDYTSNKEFLKEYYFHNVVFEESSLLNTEVIYRMFNSYFKSIIDCSNHKELTMGIDLVLRESKKNREIYLYVLELLIRSFNDAEWEEEYFYILSNYIDKDSIDKAWAKKAMNDLAKIQSLAIGKKAPPIDCINIKGQYASLYSIDMDATLILFWSADCDHCLELIPQIKSCLQPFCGKTEVFAISVDVDQMLWRRAIKTNELLNWNNIAAPEGLENEILRNYNVSYTPTMYLLNKQKEILLKTFEVDELNMKLKEYFKK